MPAPLLTFAIPYYKGLNYLEKAIQSVLEQSIPDWLLLISNDGGPDPVLEALVKRVNDSRITLVHNAHNLGMAGNWNACLNRAETPLVTLLHADDRLLPNYAAATYKAAADHPQATLFYCQTTIINQHDEHQFSLPDVVKRFIQPTPTGPYTSLKGEAALTRLLRGNFIFCPSVCYRKESLDGLRFSGQWKFVLDLDFTTHLLLNGHTFVGINEKAYAYRRHSTNATVEYTTNLVRFTEEIALFDKLASRCREKGWRRAEGVARSKIIIRLNLVYCAVSDALSGQFADAAQKLYLLSA